MVLPYINSAVGISAAMPFHYPPMGLPLDHAQLRWECADICTDTKPQLTIAALFGFIESMLASEFLSNFASRMCFCFALLWSIESIAFCNGLLIGSC